MLLFRKLCIMLLLAGILACTGALLFFVQTTEGKTLLVDTLQDFVQEKTGLLVMVGGVDVDPLRPSLTLTDVRVDGKGAPRLAGVESLSIALAPLQLLGGAVTVDDMSVVSPYLNLIVRDGKIVGLPELPKIERDPNEKKDFSLFRLLVKQFVLNGCEVRIRVEGKTPLDIALHDLRARLAVEESDLHAGTFQLGRGVIRLPNGERMNLVQLEGRATLQGDGLLRPEQLNIADARMRLDDVTGNLRGTVRFAPFSSALIPAVDMEVQGHVPLAQMPKWNPTLWPMAGSIDVNSHVRAAFGGKNPTAVGDGQLRNIEIGPFALSTWSGQFVADMSGVDITGVESDFARGDIRGQGRIDFGKDFKEVNARFSATGMDASFGEGIAGIGIKGSWVDFNIDADMEFEGQLYPEFHFAGYGRTDITDFKVFSQNFRTATADQRIIAVGPTHGESAMEFDLKHFSFIDGHISDGKTKVTGNVYLPFMLDEEFVVAASAEPDKRPGEAFDCTSVSPIAVVDLTCRGPGQVMVKGSYFNPRITGAAQLEHVTIQNYDIGDAVGEFEYQKMLLRFFNVKGQKNRTSYEGTGTLSWRAYLGEGPDGKALGHPLTQRDTLFVNIAARNINGRAEDLRAIIPDEKRWGNVMAFVRTLPLEGPVTGRADARGAIGDGSVDDLTFEAKFNAGAINLYTQDFDDALISVHMDKKQFHFDDVTLHRAGSEWKAAGTIGRADAALKVDASVGSMKLAELNVLKGSDVDGSFDAIINARGAVGDWQGPVGVDLHDVRYGRVPVGNGRLDLTMVGDRIKGSGPIFDGRATLDYAMKLEPPWAYTAQLRAERGPAQDLIGPRVLPRGLTLSFAGVATAEGTLQDAAKSRGTVALKRTVATYRDLAVHSDGDITFRFMGPRVEMERFILITDDGSKAELKGTASDRALDLDLEVVSDIAIAKLFVPSVKDAYGPVGLRLSITGTPDDPVLVGQGKLTEGTLVVNNFPHTFRKIDTNISFIRDRIVLDPLILDLDESMMKGNAEILLKGFAIEHITLNERFQDLKFRVPDYLPSRLSGDITMTGKPEDMLLTGNIDVLEARYTEQWDWENYVKDLQRRRLAPKIYDKEDEWLSLDVRLRADDKIYVKNSTMDAEFRGDLRLTGTNQRLGLLGTLTALNGRFVYRNNTFELGRSTVDFVDRNRVTPVLDVEARTHIKQYDVWVDVKGKPEELSSERGIRLYSRPDLPAVDVLSLVLFGFTQNDLNTANGAAVVGASGLDWLSSATGVDKEVRRAVPKQVVDEFYLTARTPRRGTGAVQGSVPALVVGTDLSSVLPGGRLRFTTTIMDPSGNQSDQAVELEQRWGERWSGRLIWERSSQIQQYGDAGGDIRYRYEF